MDAALPISELLADNFRKVAPGKPIFKIPVISDFSPSSSPNRKDGAPFPVLRRPRLQRSGRLHSRILRPPARPLGCKIAPVIVSGGKKEPNEQLDADIRK